ncbi:MAG: M56 family metallopeptidase [Chitinophagaceae bacterium]
MILLIYLLKMVTCSALFYGYYFFFLRNKQMHQYNRFYILISITLSIVLPLIKLPLLSTGNDRTIANTLHGIAFGGWENEIVVTGQQGFLNSIISKQNIIISVYIAGLLFTIYPVIKSLVYIRLLSSKHKAKEFDNIQFYDTAEPGTPFSFFNTIFWNNNISIETEEGQQIFRHELFHIRQKHSYDISFMQLACSLLWINPFFYLMNKELRAIHEFLADEHAASNADKHRYAELLVLQAVSSKQILISNQFFYNQIKRRITMILQNNNTRYSYIRKAMAVPVVLLIFCACSVKNKDDEHLLKAPQTMTSPTKENKQVLPAPTNNEIFTKVEIESSYPNGAKGWMQYLNKNFKYPQEAQEKESQGTVLVRFIVGRDGSISDIETIQGKKIDASGMRSNANYSTDESLNKEAIRMIAESGQWLPAIQNGHTVTSFKIQPITFKLEAE